MEVKNESEEPMAVKEEYDSDDQTLQCGGFESFSPTEDVLNNAEKSCSSNANELHLNPSMSTVEGKQ
ncbi:molybdopterin converting factor subunit 1 [Anopheles sinensis]|uniref:Molybdopterin converting factor subunit 1 n=1 Tax=Anopheles sinensis TaxID=74873 RepID=A0A084V9U9_ANOSI|nr:molybdopterin converting factor subunit 1 [Anopheles sinensis]